ncbi:MAG: hypothetical protein JNK11_14645 [Alphaproteobacteria bacterium]|nr:hypothetical protein [Alphaproteobacteria bacterium]
MLTTREFALALAGVARFARGDAGARAFFSATPEGCANSFWAAAFILVPHFAMEYLQVSQALDRVGARVDVLRFLVAGSIAYAVQWTAFPVAMHWLCGALDRRAQYFSFIAAWNWSTLLQMAVHLPIVLLQATGILGGALADAVVYASIALLLVYAGYVARVMLDVRPLVAAAIVFLDVLVTVMIQMQSLRLMGRAG